MALQRKPSLLSAHVIYLFSAIYGYNFCRSAQKAFFLIVSNALRVAAINSIGDLVLFLGKMCSVAIVMVVGREFFKVNHLTRCEKNHARPWYTLVL